MVAYFEQPFEHFKHTYIHFHTFFYLHVYQKHSININQTPGPNTHLVWEQLMHKKLRKVIGETCVKIEINWVWNIYFGSGFLNKLNQKHFLENE